MFATPLRHLPVGQPDRHRIDAARRLQMTPERDVGGGKADCAAARVAVRHRAADGPGAAEIGGGALGVAVLQHAADARGGDRAGAVGQQRHQGQPHAQSLGARGEEIGVAAAAMAEREVRAADQVPRAEALVQHLGHEGLGRHQAEFVVEAQLVQQRDAERLQRVGAFGRQGQAERRVIRAEMLARMRLEGQHAERHLRPRRVRRPDHLGMAAMHAVEIAQRHRGAARIGGQVAPVVEDAHHDARRDLDVGLAVDHHRRRRPVQTVLSVARFFSGLSAVTVAVAFTVSPIFTGAAKRSDWRM